MSTSKVNNFNGGNVPVSLAAKVMKKDPQFIRIGIRNGKLPFGTAFKKDEKQEQYDYYISPKLFYEYTGYMYQQSNSDDKSNIS
ncbi:MAG: hypothetical protein NC078_02560 [Ruminococcus sp.]|nr:hypothetical protein [Ruminococcus sp.]